MDGLKDPSGNVRATSVCFLEKKIMGENVGPKFRPILLSMVNAPYRFVSDRVVSLIYLLPCNAAEDCLNFFEEGLQDESPKVRFAAALGTDYAIEVLGAKVKDASWEVHRRDMALYGLTRSNNLKAFRHLSEALDDPVLKLHHGAAWEALKRLGSNR